MNLREAEHNYDGIKAHDNGSINAARELKFAARALSDAAEQEVVNRLSAMQKFSDDMGTRLKAVSL